MKSISYYILFGLAWLFSLIPYWLLYRISDLLYFIIYYIAGYRKKTVFKNLHSSFPEKSEQEIVHIAKSFYRHFSDFLMEIVKLMSIPQRSLNKRITVKNPEVFLQLGSEKKNFALVSAHYNNWEMLNTLPCKMKHILTVIYRPLKNKAADGLSFYMRSRYGAVMVPMENIYREALKNKAAGKLFCVWFLADQRPPRLSRFWTMFLNHETAFFEGVEKISRKMDLAVVFMDVQKVRRGHYEASLEILFENGSSVSENQITLACVRRIEQVIVKRPEFWLWSHKRFKHSRPEDVKLITA
jgi:KDO2-lipid IV(A) lauroyltransferase